MKSLAQRPRVDSVPLTTTSKDPNPGWSGWCRAEPIPASRVCSRMLPEAAAIEPSMVMVRPETALNTPPASSSTSAPAARSRAPEVCSEISLRPMPDRAASDRVRVCSRVKGMAGLAPGAAMTRSPSASMETPWS